MAKKILTIVLSLIVMLSIVGVWYYTSYPVIGVGKFIGYSSDKFEEEFYSEAISVNIVSAGAAYIPDSPLQKRKLNDVWKWNNSVVLDLAELAKEGGLAYNITVSGEIVNGKTTLRYKGYIIKKDGKRIDYLKEKTFDFVLCSEKRFFTGK